MRRCCALVVVLALSGCVFGFRITPSVTLDEHGRAGGTLLVGGTLGTPTSWPHSFASTLEVAGGVVAAKPVTGVIESDIAFEWLADWNHVAFRMGGALGVGQLQAQTGLAFFDLGARLAILPAVYRDEHHTRHGDCAHCDDLTLTTMHVGLALAADGQFGANRARFSVGPTFEYYTLSNGSD